MRRERERYPIRSTLPGEHNLANLAAAIAAARTIGMSIEAHRRRDSALGLAARTLRTRCAPRRRSRRLRCVQRIAVRDAGDAARRSPTKPRRDASRSSAGWPSSARSRRRCTSKSVRQPATAESTCCWPAERTQMRSCAVRVDAGMPAERCAARTTTIVSRPQWLRENLRDGDAILLKGSRMYKMEEILSALRDPPRLRSATLGIGDS